MTSPVEFLEHEINRLEAECLHQGRIILSLCREFREIENELDNAGIPREIEGVEIPLIVRIRKLLIEGATTPQEV